MKGVRVHKEEESLGAVQTKAAQGESGAGLRGKILTLGKSLHIDGSGTVWSHSQKEIFRTCSFGTPEIKIFC